MEYTHNLKLILVNKNNSLIKDDVFLEEVKTILCQSNTCDLEWNGKINPFTYQWIKRNLTELESHLMGDLFLNPIYEFDTLLVRHVKQILSKINCEYKIIFYITRIIGDKSICRDSAGSINVL